MPLVLPETVNAVMTDDSRQAVPVTWDLPDEQDRLMHTSGPAVYEIAGKADGMDAKCFVSMIEYNFLQDYSFEEDNGSWIFTDLKKADELMYLDKEKYYQSNPKQRR